MIATNKQKNEIVFPLEKAGSRVLINRLVPISTQMECQSSDVLFKAENKSGKPTSGRFIKGIQYLNV